MATYLHTHLTPATNSRFGDGEIMFAETVIGYIDLIEHKFPQRSYKRELNAALHLSLCFHLIDRAHDRSSRKRALSEQIFRCALWNTGEKSSALLKKL
ncbi:hypothetical protein HGG76_25075 [Ochrobactrum tritici]|uniref:Uncharacterized protein n=1 Tax=Brucella tritici TaxID=94626 RepID=A0A7X6FSB8_9HYPH|nr:hypothetical protein [Brucella tritici]